jgi:hypothetical protein
VDNDDYTPYYTDSQYDVSDAEQRRIYGITDDRVKSDKSDKDWYLTPSGDKCPWCKDGLTSPFEPEDEEDAEMSLCRGHAAEYAGLSLDGMDRRDQEEMYDYL